MANKKTDEETPFPADGIVPASAVTSTDPELVYVRANVHILGLDAGDVVEIEKTQLIKGLIEIGHFTVVQPEA